MAAAQRSQNLSELPNPKGSEMSQPSEFQLIKVTIADGEHEHASQVIYQGTEKEARAWVDEEVRLLQEEFDNNGIEDDQEPAYFSFGGDGTTLLNVYDIEQISEKDAEVLNRLGVAYTVNEKVTA